MEIFIKIFIILIVSGLFSHSIKAQNNKDKSFNDKLTFSVTSALSITTLSGKHPTVIKGVFSTTIETISGQLSPIYLGAGLDYKFNKKTYLQLDLVLKSIGGQITERVYLYNEIGKVMDHNSYNYKQTYISLPITAKFIIKDRFYFDMGVYSSVLLFANKYMHWHNIERPTTNNIKPFDYGLIIGTGISFHHLHLGFQYTYGLHNILKHQDWTMHNVSYQIILRANIWSLKTNKSAL